MYTVLFLSERYYAKKHSIDSEREINDFVDYVDQFTEEGTPILLVKDLEDAANMLNISALEITLVTE